MAKTVGSISVNFTAGTAQFVTAVETAKAKVRDFSTHTITDVQAAGAAFRTLEGNLSIRAVEQFATKFLGLGPILRAAFPVVGAVALGDVLLTTGEKATEFFNKVRFGAESIAAAFRNLNAPLRATNDELRITNDRLDNDIAKLEGKRQNTLKLALDEARKAADDLADSLLKDLGALEKLMKEENISRLRGFFTGEASTTKDYEDLFGKTGQGGFYGRIGKITDDGSALIGGTKDKDEQKRLKAKENAFLEAEYGNQIKKTADALALAERNQKANAAAVEYTVGARGNLHLDKDQKFYADEASRIEFLRGALHNLNMEKESIALRQDKIDKTQRKEGDEASKSNMLAYKPVSDKIKELQAQLEGVNVKMAAIGKPEAIQVAAKAAAEATKELARLNKELESHASSVSKADAAKLKSLNLSIANTEAEAQWKQRLDASWTATANRIRAQELLTAAIGKGYEATKQASVEAQLLEELGDKAFDQKFMGDHSSDIEARRKTLASKHDADLGAQVAGTIDKLETQTEIERALFEVEAQGALAVARLTEAFKERDAYFNNQDAGQIKAMREQFEASQATAIEKSVRPLQEKLRLTQAIIDAQSKGAEAERKAANEEKYSQLAKDKGQGVADAQRELDALERQHQIQGKAVNSGGNFGDRLQENAKMIESLKYMKAYYQDTFDIELRLRELENERLHILAEQTLQIGTAQAGVKAFFIEMQAEAKKASQIVYEALNSALDKVSDNISKLATGQKANWGKAFQDVGGEMVKSSTKSLLQSGIGALGKVFGIDTSGLVKPDGTKGNPIYVRNADGIGGSITGALGKAAGGGLFGGGDKGGGIFSFLGSLLIPHAAGGPTSPGGAYLVGENGPEILFSGSHGSVINNAESRRMIGGGGDTHQYFVDARGADQTAFDAKMVRVLEAVHNSAAATGVRATFERAKRVPGGG